MANVFILNICLVLILSGVESCFIPNSLYIIVPRTIQTGRKITTVEAADCDIKSMVLTLSDPSFTIGSNGEIEAARPVLVAAGGRTFSVWARDSNGPESEMVVHLVHSAIQERKPSPSIYLKRSKRRWSPPPFNILENDRGPYPKEIEKIVSDSEVIQDVYYTISGPGVNSPPLGVFSLDRITGMLIVHKAVDREEFPRLILTTRVFNINTNVETDKPLDLEIIVDDVNDNAPTFKDPLQFTVLEQCPRGSVVGLVTASDRDEAGSLHVKIRYSLLSGLDRFAIHQATGVISTVTNTLDREVQDTIFVTVQIKDMDGGPQGLFNTGTATIRLGDINDNPPTFQETSYSTTVKENQVEKMILRIPIEDKDLVNTPNTISKFVITKGNENGNFRIQTDPNTNEGLLYVAKALDYEKNKKVMIEIMVRNEAELNGTTANWNSVPVEINVEDEDEGPEFSAPTVTFTVRENTPNGTLIGTYKALDPETKRSSSITYQKISDPASWINVDKNTGALTVANTIDRESHFVHNGIYNITMNAVDASLKTATGTVIIVVEDENDNMPLIPGKTVLMCAKKGQFSSAVVVAEDADQSPFSSPFSFSLPDDHDGQWSLTTYNSTAVTLQQAKDLPRGIYSVPLAVKDLQGFGKTQTATVRICQCSGGVCPAIQNSVSLGPLALLTMLLPVALLLLLGLLLAFICRTQNEKIQLADEGDSGGILLKSNTESPGEEVVPSLINVPILGTEQIGKGSVKGSMVNAGWPVSNGFQDNGMYKSDIKSDVQDYYSSQYDQYGQLQGGLGSGVAFDNRYITQDSNLHHNWQTNGNYLNQKLAYFGATEDGRYADDLIHCYGFEGAGSAAGSVGCCSEIGDNNNLDFLNTLGPKFKTLGDVCK